MLRKRKKQYTFGDLLENTKKWSRNEKRLLFGSPVVEFNKSHKDHLLNLLDEYYTSKREDEGNEITNTILEFLKEEENISDDISLEELYKNENVQDKMEDLVFCLISLELPKKIIESVSVYEDVVP